MVLSDARGRGVEMATMHLDQLLPGWHHRERHTIGFRAPPGAGLRAMHELTWREVPVFRALSLVASLGRRRVPGSRQVLEQLLAGGFRRLYEGDDELVVGAIVRVTPPRGPVSFDRSGPGEFRAFEQPGHYKVAINFYVRPGVLGTETRVLSTDESARRRFRRHWLLIRLPSAAVRRDWLRAIRRRAGAR